MTEVGGIKTADFKEIELENALRETIRDPDKTLRLLVKLCKRVETLERETEQLNLKIEGLSRNTGVGYL